MEEIYDIIEIFTERDITYKLEFILDYSFPFFTNTANIRLDATGGPLSNKYDFLNEYVKDRINKEITNYIIKKFIKNQENGLAFIITSENSKYPLLFSYFYPKCEYVELNLEGTYRFKNSNGKVIKDGNIPIRIKDILKAVFDRRPINFNFFKAHLDNNSYWNEEIFIVRNNIKELDIDIDDIIKADIYIQENKPVIKILGRSYKLDSIDDSIIETFGLEIDYTRIILKNFNKLKAAIEKAQKVYDDFQKYLDEITDDLKLAVEIQNGKLK